VIADRVVAVREVLVRAAARAGRSPAEVVLVAVCKTHPADAVRAAFEAGLTDFGENRVQEAEPKIAALESLRARGLRWHLIGHLQSNKARRAAALFDSVHSVDSVDLAKRLDRLAREAGRVLPVMVEVDLAGEETKAGIPAPELLPGLEEMTGLDGLRVEGLMLLPPYTEDRESVRPYFQKLRKLRDDAVTRGLLAGRSLSMGMSHDFEVAIEEGATHVRVGTAIFGERP